MDEAAHHIVECAPITNVELSLWIAETGAAEVARLLGVTRKTAERWRDGKGQPNDAAIGRLRTLLLEWRARHSRERNRDVLRAIRGNASRMKDPCLDNWKTLLAGETSSVGVEERISEIVAATGRAKSTISEIVKGYQAPGEDLALELLQWLKDKGEMDDFTRPRFEFIEEAEKS